MEETPTNKAIIEDSKGKRREVPVVSKEDFVKRDGEVIGVVTSDARPGDTLVDIHGPATPEDSGESSPQ